MQLESPNGPAYRVVRKDARPALWIALLFLLCALGWWVCWQIANARVSKHPVPDSLDQAVVAAVKALNHDDAKSLRSLLQHHPEIISVKIPDSGGESFLSRSIDFRYRASFDVLLEMGASVESDTDLERETVLMLCARSNRAEYAKVLLERGANPVGLYQPKKGDPRRNQTVDQASQRAPLALAAMMGSVEVAELLIAHGAPIVLDKKGNETALHWAAMGSPNTRSMVQLLLKHGANPNARNSVGCTPLHIAAMNHCFEGAQALFEFAPKQIALDRRTITGDTELGLAIEEMAKHATHADLQATAPRQKWLSESIALVKLLIEKGAELETSVKVLNKRMSCREAINALPVPELQKWLKSHDKTQRTEDSSKPAKSESAK